MRQILFLFVFSLLFNFSADAQNKKVLHQTFNVDGIESLHLEVVGEVEVIKWAGNAILSETSIELYDANASIFNYFLDHGRYQLLGKKEGNNDYLLFAKDKAREPIRTSKGQCWEIVRLRLYIPDTFEASSSNANHLSRVLSDDQLTGSTDK